MSLVFIIEDEPMMAECIALAATGETTYPADRHANILSSAAEASVMPDASKPRIRIFNDAVSAMDGLREEVPDVILLDVLLTGPDGFTFLNELASYSDTMRVPVALVTSLDLSQPDLAHYGVFRILHKTTMTPEDIYAAVIDGIALSAAQPAQNPATPQPLATQVFPDQPLPNQSPLSQPTANPVITETYTGLANLQSSLSNIPETQTDPNQPS